jgi:hypothetical protein
MTRHGNHTSSWRRGTTSWIGLLLSTRGSLGASQYPRTGLHGQSLRRIEGRLVGVLELKVGRADSIDKAREVFQTALEFFGDEEEQIEKAQVGSPC